MQDATEVPSVGFRATDCKPSLALPSNPALHEPQIRSEHSIFRIVMREDRAQLMKGLSD